MVTFSECERCRRAVMGVPEEDGVVCTGCLTMREDLEETEAVIALLERHAALERHDSSVTEAVHAAIETALANLNARLGLEDLRNPVLRPFPLVSNPDPHGSMSDPPLPARGF
jgi:hypothetical protein